MSVETGLYTLLQGDVVLAGLVQTRIWPVKRTKDTGYPCLTYRRRDGAAEYGLWDAPVLFVPLWEIDCFGETYAAARAVANRVKALLVRFIGDLGGVEVAVTMLMRDEDGALEQNGVEILRARLWFQMTYKE